MKIEKRLTETIHLEQWEIELLQRFLEYARRYINDNNTEDYDNKQDCKVDFLKISEPIFDL